MNQKGFDSSGFRVHCCRKRTDPRSEDSDSGSPKREKVTVARLDVEEVSGNAGGGDVGERHGMSGV